MYQPTLANFISSFLINAEEYLEKINISKADSYMQYARYVISSLAIATEMLLKDWARNKVNLIIDPTPNSKYDFILRRKYGNNLDKLRDEVIDKSIFMAHLLTIYKEGTSPKYFQLQSIQDDNQIQILDDFRKYPRNQLIHNGRLSPNDFDIIKDSFNIISEVYKEIYHYNYKLIRYIEQIQKIPNENPYIYIIEVYDNIKKDLKLFLDSSKIVKNWKIYCYSKFVICYLFSLAVEKLDTRKHESLLRWYHNFADFESEKLEKDEYIAKLFNEARFNEIYNLLKDIQKKIFALEDDSEFRILNWSELELLKNIMNEEYEILIVQTTYKRTKKALLSDKDWTQKWRKKRKLDNKSTKERKQFLDQVVINFRNKITRNIALEMFELSLLFCRKYLTIYYFHI